MKFFRILRHAGAVLDLVRKVAAVAQDKQTTEAEVREVLDEAIPLARALGLIDD